MSPKKPDSNTLKIKGEKEFVISSVQAVRARLKVSKKKRRGP